MDGPPVSGGFSWEVAHLLGGAVLACSFGLLYQRRLTGVINTYAVQSCLLAATAAWQGWAQSSPALVLAGLIVLAGAGVAMPMALRHIAGRLQIDGSVAAQPGIFPAMAAGAALVLLAMLLVPPATPDIPAVPRVDLALALSVVLLGLLMMVARPTAPAQLVGFLSLQSGLILAAVGVRGMRLVVELSVAVLVLAGAAVAGVFLVRIRERFDTVDASGLDRPGGPPS